MKRTVCIPLISVMVFISCGGPRAAYKRDAGKGELSPCVKKLEVKDRNGLWLMYEGEKKYRDPVSQEFRMLFSDYKDTTETYNSFLDSYEKRENITKSVVGTVASGLMLAAFGSMFFDLIKSIVAVDEIETVKKGLVITGLSVAGTGLLVSFIFGPITDSEMKYRLEKTASEYNAHCE